MVNNPRVCGGEAPLLPIHVCFIHVLVQWIDFLLIENS